LSKFARSGWLDLRPTHCRSLSLSAATHPLACLDRFVSPFPSTVGRAGSPGMVVCCSKGRGVVNRARSRPSNNYFDPPCQCFACSIETDPVEGVRVSIQPTACSPVHMDAGRGKRDKEALPLPHVSFCRSSPSFSVAAPCTLGRPLPLPRFAPRTVYPPSPPHSLHNKSAPSALLAPRSAAHKSNR